MRRSKIEESRQSASHGTLIATSSPKDAARKGDPVVHATLYITDIPLSLTETKLRSILHGYQIHSLTFIHTIHGNVGMVHAYTLEDAHKISATLSRFKLSIYPAESIAGQGIEQLLPQIAEVPNTSARTA